MSDQARSNLRKAKVSKIEYYRAQNRVPKPLPEPLDTSKLRDVPQQ